MATPYSNNFNNEHKYSPNPGKLHRVTSTDWAMYQILRAQLVDKTRKKWRQEKKLAHLVLCY